MLARWIRLCGEPISARIKRVLRPFFACAIANLKTIVIRLSTAPLLPFLVAASFVAPSTPAYAISNGCAAVNAGGLDQIGASLLVNKSVTGAFYAGDVLTMTFSSSAALPLSVVTLSTTGSQRQTSSLELPLLGTGPYARSLTIAGNGTTTGAEAGILALGALLGVTINLTVRCTGVVGPTTTTLTSAPNPSVVGQSAVFTATVATPAGSGQTPNGNVTFNIGGTNYGPVALNASGIATYSTSALPPGSYAATASYAGNSSFVASTGLLASPQVVGRANTTTAVTASASPTFGSPVTFTATTAAVTPGGGTPAGSIIFTIGGVDQSPVTLSNGTATITRPNLPAGVTSVAARYDATTSYNASSGTLSGGVTVAPATTTTTLSGPGSVAFGTTPTITATVAGAGGTPTGTVVFTVDGVARPAATLSSGAATITLPGLSVGTHTVSAAYSGATSYGTSTGSLSGSQIVTAAPTTLAVAASPSTGLYGGSSTFTASVTSTAGVPTGNVIFTVDGVAQAPIALAGGTASLTSNSLSVGSHTVSASYQGATNFLASSGALAVSYAVSRATPSVAVTSSANPAVTGQAIQLTANVTASSGTPSGEVVFTVDGVARPATLLNNGSAMLSLPSLSVGDHTVSVRYAGDANFVERTSTLGGGQKVNPGNTALTLTTSSASAAFGAPVTITANVAAAGPASGTPGGQVVFLVDGAAQPATTLSNGQAQLVLNSLAPGAHSISVAYQGSGDFNASTASLSGGVSVSAATTTTSIALDTAAISYGQAARVTATVTAASGRPAGQIVYTINGVARPAVALVDGVAALDLGGLAAGSYTISAAYGGSANHVASTSDTTQLVVGPAATQLAVTASSQSVRFGDPVTFSAGLTSAGGTPSGSIAFFAGNTPLGTAPLVDGKATLTVSSLAVGTPAISARYAGNTNFAASTGSVASFAVTGRVPDMSVSVSPSSTAYGQNLTATISLSSTAGTPQGNIVLTVGDQQYPAALNGSGGATVTLSGLAPGSFAVSASYAGQSPFLGANASTNAVTITRAATALTVLSGAESYVFGDSLQLRANVTSDFGTPAGSVVFTVDGTDYPASVADGSASISILGIGAGQHSVSARYAGSPTHQPSTASLANGVTVSAAPTSLSLTSSAATITFGGSTTVTAALTSSAGKVTGDIVFSVDGVDRAPVPVTNGAAQLQLTGLTVGSHAVSARYQPAAGFQQATAQLSGGVSVVAAPVSVAIAPPVGQITVGQSARFTVTVGSTAGVPSGQFIAVVDGVDQPPVTLSNGGASFDYTFATAGSHTMALRYLGSESLAAGIGGIQGGVMVLGASSALALSAEPSAPTFGQSTQFVATVTSPFGTPAGIVTFSRGGTNLGSAPLTDGVASLTLNNLPPGNSAITAAYAGDAAHIGSNGALSLDVAEAATTLALGANPTTLYVGAPVTFTATITSPAGAVPGSVVFVVGSIEYVAAIADGTAVLVLNDLPAGKPAVSARFDGQPGFAPSQVALGTVLTIEPPPTDIEVHAQLSRSVAGQSLTLPLSATGGIAPYRFAVTAGSLPAGVTLDPATGTISGTPVTPGDYSFTVTASGAAGQPGSAAVNLTVLAPATLTVPQLGAGTYGESLSTDLSASGGTAPYQYALSGSLPTGVTFDPATATLSGTPTALGAFNLSLQVVDANGFTLARDLTLTIAAPQLTLTADLPEAGAFVPFSGQVSATGGTGPYSYAVTDGSLPDGLSLDAASGTISGTPRRVGDVDFTITATDANGFAVSRPISLAVAQVFTVVLPDVVAEARQFRPYGQVLRASGGTAPYAYWISDGGLPEGLVLDEASGTLSGTPSGFGSFAFTLSASDANGVTGSQSYSLVVDEAATLVLDADLLPATAGVEYERILNVSGGAAPYSFALVSGDLPDGLGFDAATGTISGTATQDGSFPLVIQIVDANGDTVTESVLVTVQAPAISLSLDLPAATAGESFASSVEINGGAAPFAYALAGALPAGLIFDATTGAITGTPTGVGSFPIRITASDANGYEQSADGTIEITATTTTSLVADQTTITFGGSVELVATVESAASEIAGRVVVLVDGVDHARVDLTGSEARFALQGLTVGRHAIAARFEPADGFVASSAELATAVQVVAAPVSVAITAPDDEIIAGSSVRFSASITSSAGTPMGQVIPMVDGVDQPPVTLTDGVALFDVSFATTGNHMVSLRYVGSDSFAAGTGMLPGGVSVVGAGSDIALTANPGSPSFGQPVMLTATVSSTFGSPTGVVTFTRDGAEIGTAVLVGDVAGLTVTDLPPGSSRITATYQGDAARQGASAEVTLEASDATTSLSLTANPTRVYAGALVTLTASVTSDAGSPPGEVVFALGDIDYAAPVVDGIATLTLTDLAEGNYPVTARFAGQPGFAASQASLAADLVVDPAPTDILLSAQTQRSVAGENLAITVSATGGVAPYVFAIADGALPDGLVLDPATGTIAGAPTTPGDYSFTIAATGEAGAPGEVTVTLTVLAPVSFSALPTLPDGVFGTPYGAELAVSGGTLPIQYVLAGNLPSGLSFDAATGTLSGTPAALGRFDLSLTVTDANGFSETRAYILHIAAPAIEVTAELPVAGAFVPYAGRVTASGGNAPYTYTISDGALPVGMSLDPETGAIAGTSRVVGESSFTIAVTDANGFSTSLPVSLAVEQVFTVVLPDAVATGRQFQPFAQPLAATGGTAPYAYEISDGALPAGLSLDATTGVVSGTPGAPGSFTFTVTATDANGVASTAGYTLDIAEAATLSIETALQPATAGIPYGQGLVVTGGTAPYEFALVSGTLPDGMSFDAASGSVSGTAREDGSFPLVIQIRDANGDTATQTVVVTVTAPDIALSLDVPPARAGEDFESTVVASGGAAPLRFALDGDLPSGLAFNAATGVISGTPTGVGIYPITVTATDANGYTQSASATISLSAATTLTLSTASPRIPFGSNAQVQAEVTSTAPGISGTVTFTVDGRDHGSVPLSGGRAQLDLSALVVGAHAIAARFESNDGYDGATADLAGGITVTAAPVMVSIAGPSGGAAVGASVPFTVTVNSLGGVPGGVVIPIIDGVDQPAVPLMDSVAAFTHRFATSGSHSVAVRYPGNESFGAGSAALASNVEIAGATSALSLAAAPAAPRFGMPVTVSATVSSSLGTPTGLVVFSRNGIALGSVPLSDGSASLVLRDLPAGASTIIATYQGDAANAGSTSQIDLTLADVATTLSLSANPTTLYAGAPVILSASLTSEVGAVPGSVVFTVGGSEYPAAISGDAASLTLSNLPEGSYPIGVRFDGAPGFAASQTSLADNIVVQPAPSDIVVGATPPRSVAGQPLAITVSATGGVAPYAFAITSGALPAGLELDQASGRIIGTPEEARRYSFTVTATGQAGAPGSVAVELTVLAPAIITTQASLPTARFGEDYQADLGAGGGTAPYQYVLAGNLPPGLSFDTASGMLSGMPQAVGTFPLSITIADANGFTATEALDLVVAAPVISVAAEFAEAGAFVSYAGQVTASGGTAPYGFSVTEGVLPAGLSLDPQSGAVSGTPRVVGASGFTITVTDANGFAASVPVSINVAQVFTVILPADLAAAREFQPYGQVLTATGGTAPYAYTISAGALPDGLEFDAETGTISGTPQISGSFAFTLTATDANGVAGSASYTLDVAQAATLASGADLAPATAGTPYDQALEIAGGLAPYRFTLVSGDLPNGLSFDPATGAFSGTATQDGSFPLAIRIIDANGDSATQTVVLTVAPPDITLVIDLPAAAAGEAYAGSVRVTGGAAPLRFTLAGDLPEGLSFDAATGVLSGIPSEAGTFPIAITATDANGYAQTTQASITITAETSLSLAASSDAISFGETVEVTATVSGATRVSGDVIFTVDGVDRAPVSLGDGSATLTLDGLAVGAHVVSARFEGGSGITGSRGDLAGGISVTAAASAVTVTAPPGGAVVGAPAEFRIAVSSALGTPQGEVVPVVDGVDQPAVVLVDGAASFTVSFANAGNHAISVRYPGSDSFAAASGVLGGGVDVSGAGSELTLSADPVAPSFGQAVTVIANVTSNTGTPGGQVVFSRDGTEIASVPLVGGVASLTLGDLVAGDNTITAAYWGDAAHLGSEAQIEIDLADVATTLAVSAEPATVYAGAPVTFTATVGSSARAVSGSVVFVIGDTEYAAGIDGDRAVLKVGDLAQGSYPVSVRYDGQPGFAPSTATLSADLIVEPAPSDIVVSAQVPRSVAGEEIVISISATGGVGPYAFTLNGDLPDGMGFDPATGAVSGTPVNPGRYSFTVTASGSAGAPGSAEVNLVVLTPAEIAAPSTLPSARYGEAFSADLSANGGTAPYQYRLDGTLPEGVNFDPQGAVLSGTPRSTGNYALTLAITDANGFTATQSFTLTVAAPSIAVSAELPEAGAFVPFSGQIRVSGGSAPYRFAVTDGALPDGLSLDAESGAIAGTPRQVGEAGFMVTVTDANGFTASLPVSLAVEQVFTVTLPEALADGREAQAYGQSLGANGGTVPYAYAVTSGALPGGLVLDPQSGVLSGTPTGPGSFAFTVTATDANGVAGSGDYTLVIVDAVTLVPDTALDSPVAGAPYRKVLSVAGGRSPYRFALVSGALPQGMSLDAATGTIAGTATEAGTFSFAVAITDADGASVTQSFALAVAAPVIDLILDLPMAGAGQPFQSGVVITGGAEPFQFTLSGALPAGLVFDPQTGRISGTPTQSGSFPVIIAATDANGFVQSTEALIEVQDTAPPVDLVVGDIDLTSLYGADYAQTISVTGGTAPYAFAIEAGALPEGLTLDPTSGAISGTPRQTGRFSMLLAIRDSAGNRAQRSFALEVDALPFTPDFPAAIPPATGGESYQASLAVSGDLPITYVVSQGALPPGLSLDPASGTLTGTATQAGTFSFEITAIDAHEQSASASYTLAVEAPQFEVAGALPGATGGEVYGATLSPNGGTAPYRFALVSPLPAGMSFDANTGRLSGAPTVAGDFDILVQITDAAGFSNTITIPLSIAAPEITFGGVLPAAQVGASFLFTPSISGGTPGYSFVLASGALPTGLILEAATGTISGLPTLAENASFTLVVTDASGFSATRSFALPVASNLGSAELPASISAGQVGVAFTDSIAASGGQALTYAVTAGALPQGLTLDPTTGAVSGTPTLAGTSLFTITATDSSGRRNAQHYVMAIASPAMVVDNGFPLGTIGQSYSDDIAVSGGIAPYSYALSNAPRDLTIDPRTGVISGLPRETGSFDVVITVTDAVGHSAQQAGRLTVQRRALALLLRDIDPNAWTSASYDSSIAATNGIAPVTYDVVDGDLPEGVSLSPEGELTGSPRRVGRWAFTIRAVDAEGNMGTRAYAMEVADEPVDDAALQIAVTLDPDVAELGSAVRFEVTVTNAGEAVGDGSVSLLDADSGELIDSTVLGSSGTATFSLVTETAGQRSFVVQYSGSPGVSGGSSDPVTLTTNPATTTLSLEADPSSPEAGEDITLTATIERVAPSAGTVTAGNVVFSVNGEDIASVPVSGGVATTTTTLAAGSSTVAARFQPADDNDLPSESTMSIVARGTVSITLSGPEGTVQPNDPLTYTVTVSPNVGGPAPTGSVSFLVDGSEVASIGISNGSASVTLDPLPAGPHQISAVYSGDVVYDAATAQPISLLVEPDVAQPQATTTALTPSTGTPVVGDPVTLTATVTGSQSLRPTGIVRFIDQTTGTGIGTGTLNGDGQATLLHRFTVADTRTISAEYQGDALNLPSRDQLTFNIVPSPTQISLSAASDTVSPEGTTELTAQFSRMPNGRGPPHVDVIEFRADNVVFASVPTDGETAVTVESPPIEMTTQFTAALVPEAASQTDLPSTSSPVVVSISAAALDPTTTVLTIAPNPSLQGQAVTMTATVTGTSGPADGAVRFIQGPDVLDTVTLSGGVASFTTSSLPLGSSPITAQFLANAVYATSTDTATATVNPLPGQAYLTISGSAQPNVVAGAGQPVSLALQVGAVGGSVSNVALSIPGATGISCPSTVLAAGATMQCTATYVTSFSDIGQGNLAITATVTGDNADPASTTITVASQVSDVVDTFEDLTNQFISARARMVTGISLPNVFDRRIAPGGNRPGSLNAQANGASQTFQFASSLEQWRGFANSPPDGGPAVPLDASPFNAWVDVRLALHGSQDDAQQWSRLAVAAAGVDYLINDNLLIGVAAQADWMIDHTGQSEFTGAGYLIGPYASIGLAENVSLDLALFYGQSFNQARAEIGGVTYTGEFETDRLLASAGLSGFYELNEFILRPSATFFLSSERSGDYVVSDADGNSVPIPSQEILDLQLRGGLTIERTIELDDGARLTPMVGLNLSYGGTLGESGFDDRLTGGVMAGLLYSNGSFSAKGSIEADFGMDGFEGATGRITIGGKF